MNKPHQTTLRDRIKDAINALRGKPHHSMTLGLEIKRCDKCSRPDLDPIKQRIQADIKISRDNYGCEGEYRAGLYRALDIIGEEERRWTAQFVSETQK